MHKRDMEIREILGWFDSLNFRICSKGNPQNPLCHRVMKNSWNSLKISK